MRHEKSILSRLDSAFGLEDQNSFKIENPRVKKLLTVCHINYLLRIESF